MDADCFPTTPGTTRQATITGTVFIAHRLASPLAVTCTSEVELTPFHYWTMTLRYDWGTPVPGHAELVVVVLADGFGGDSYGVEDMPGLYKLEAGEAG